MYPRRASITTCVSSLSVTAMIPSRLKRRRSSLRACQSACTLRGQILSLQVLTARVVGPGLLPSHEVSHGCGHHQHRMLHLDSFCRCRAGARGGDWWRRWWAGNEGFSWSKAFSRSVVSRSSHSAEYLKLRADHDEDRAKIGGTGVDARGPGSSVLPICEKKDGPPKKKLVR